MKIHRFIGDFKFEQSHITITEIDIVKQARNVLKLEPGETIILSDGKGMEAEVIIESISKNSVTGAIISKKLIEAEAGHQVVLYLSILKKENFELAVQKATEIGVTKIVPVITARTVKTGLNFERLKKITKEASEQSGRTVIPQIAEITEFKTALQQGESAEEKIIFHFSDHKYSHPHIGLPYVSSIFVGPEGGFTEQEISLAKEFGYQVASLGPLTLRAETAAMIGTYAVKNN